MENNDIKENTNNTDVDMNVEPQSSDIKLEPEGESISGHVKQDVVSQLVEMGFTRNVAEKACFFNQSILEKSIEWIYEHQGEPDFEEELRIVGQKETEKLSEEEIKKKAKELQEEARRRYVEKQKQLEEEQERNRVRQSKYISLKLSKGAHDGQKRYGGCRSQEIYRASKTSAYGG
jgi:uncharacterized UBP type Zn finger protein